MSVTCKGRCPRSLRPASIWLIMVKGSSVRGLSLVTMTRSLPRAAACPINGRLVRSRSPPQPNTSNYTCKIQSSQNFQNLGQGIGSMGVINKHQRLPGNSHRFQAAVDAGNGSQAVDNMIRIDSQSQGGAAGGQDIGKIIMADQGRAEFEAAEGGGQAGLDTPGRQGKFFRLECRLRVRSHRLIPA